MSQNLKPHPYSLIFPGAYGEPFWELVTSIKRMGRLRYAIVLYQDKVLDGNQRLRACKEAGVKPTFRKFEGTDAEALELVWELNFARRQLTPSGIATCIAKYKLQGERIKLCTGADFTPSVEKLAEQKGVSPRTVHYAEKVLRDGTKDEKAALESGEAKAKPLAEAITQREKEAPDGVIRDLNGMPVPPAAMLYWKRAPEVKTILNQMRAVKAQVEKLVDGDPLYAIISLSGVIGDLSNAIGRFSAAMPEYVCPYCKGIKVDGCKQCHGSGVMNGYIWKFVPPEFKK